MTDQAPNPFGDPSSDDESTQRLAVESTLSVGRNASLTLGTDTLVVFDEHFDEQKCCGLIPTSPKSTRVIPFFNVLWAALSEYDVSIDFANQTSKTVVRRSAISYPIEKTDRAKVSLWVNTLLSKAYGESQKRKRIKVLINPFGGKGSAQKWWRRDIEPIFSAAQCEIHVEKTQYKEHAVDIAEKLDIDSFDVVAACSGDGVPHEVFNGLGKRRDARKALQKIAVVQLPCGSGNAMSTNLNGTDSPSLAALSIVKGLRMPLDLVSITQGDKRTLSFLTQSVGIIAESDLGTDHLRWMGSQRFTYGLLKRLLGKTVYPCDVAIAVEHDSKEEIKAAFTEALSAKNELISESRTHSAAASSDIVNDEGLPPPKFGSVSSPLPENWTLTQYPTLGNFYVGNMSYVSSDINFFPAALPSDGCMDMVMVDGNLARHKALGMLFAAEKGAHFPMEHVRYRKVVGYQIVPRGKGDGEGHVSIDGESFPFEPFRAEIHRALGTVLSKSGRLFEAKGIEDVVLT